jgi:uncharacterized protein (DUF1330 family)
MDEGYVDPIRARFGEFRGLAEEGPIHMLNLVRFRDRAAYPDGREASGEEAYAAYGRESGPIFRSVGGRIAWAGDFRLMLIGPQEESWDRCFIAEYPSGEAFVTMVKDPAYQSAVIHRQAAVLTSRLIRFNPVNRSEGFAG